MARQCVLAALWMATFFTMARSLIKQQISDGSSSANTITIPLSKQYVPVKRNNRTVMHRTAYYGRVFLGLPQPQEFTVVFDTGSAHFLVPSSKCKSESCFHHNRYERSLSQSAVDIDHDGVVVHKDSDERDQVSIEFGTGEMNGEFAREVVCLTSRTGELAENALTHADCTRLRVVFATEMTSEPFMAFKFDGVLGLSLDSLALDPEFSFFGQMTKLNPNMQPHFGVFISKLDHLPSEISFGGHDQKRVSSDINWAPVLRPELGYWQIRLKKVIVGGEEVELCQSGDCAAIVDTGTSLLGVPRQVAQHMHWLLARKVPTNPDQLDCRSHAGPDIVFDLGDVQLSLGPEEYSRPAGLRIINNQTNETQFVCRASLLPVDEGPSLSNKTWLLGEPVLRKYYTAFDWVHKKIGFSPSIQPELEVPSSNSSHEVLGAPDTSALTPTVVYI